MKDNCFEDIWMWILITLSILVISVITVAVVSNHDVKGYYLSKKNFQLSIMVDIPWCTDYGIPLDRNISYKEAIELVNELNRGLIK